MSAEPVEVAPVEAASFTHMPTPYPELNNVLYTLVTRAQSALGETFVGAYLQGSFAIGDFDEHSDVDFLIAIANELSADQLDTLQTMHAEIFALPWHWAQHLEGSYIPLSVLSDNQLVSVPVPYLDNGSQELVLSTHDNTLVTRWTTRERGITLAGPLPQQIIAPVTADELRAEIRAVMRDWGAEILSNPAKTANRWGQPFVVLSYCRMLHSLHTGTIESKLAGVRWAQDSRSTRWYDLIERALAERPDPSSKVRQPSDPAQVALTLEFVREAMLENRE
jgi:predicted nucleotidyltransferase